MEQLFILVIIAAGASLLGIVIITYLLFARKKAQDVLSQALKAPVNKWAEIIYMGDGGLGYRGKILSQKAIFKGETYIEVKDEEMGIRELLIGGNNIIDVSGLEKLTCNVMLLCNVDWNNKNYDWRPEVKTLIKGGDMIMESRIREEVKNRFVKELELLKQIQKPATLITPSEE